MNTFVIPQTIAYSIAENCPRAFTAFLICKQYADKKRYYFERDFITDSKCLSWSKFRNDLRCLARQGFVEYKEDIDGVEVKLCMLD